MQPAFTAVAALSIPGALFGEVECRKEQALCQAAGAGSGGWVAARLVAALSYSRNDVAVLPLRLRPYRWPTVRMYSAATDSNGKVGGVAFYSSRACQ